MHLPTHPGDLGLDLAHLQSLLNGDPVERDAELRPAQLLIALLRAIRQRGARSRPLHQRQAHSIDPG